MDIKPQAMAMPKDTASLPQGKYGPIFPKSPACHGFTIIAKIIPGREPVFYEYAQNIEKAVAAMPNCLALSSVIPALGVIPDRRSDLLHVPGFSIPTSTSTPKMQWRFSSAWREHRLENLEGFPEDWKTNPNAFVKFVRDHQCPSFLEYGEYPFFSADEIRKALKLKRASRRRSISCSDVTDITRSFTTEEQSEEGES